MDEQLLGKNAQADPICTACLLQCRTRPYCVAVNCGIACVRPRASCCAKLPLQHAANGGVHEVAARLKNAVNALLRMQGVTRRPACLQA